MTHLSENWPQMVLQTLKDKIAQLFQLETSSHALQNMTCACCAELCLVSDCKWFSTDSVDLSCFHCSDDQLHLTQSEIHSNFAIPHPFTTGILKTHCCIHLGVCQVDQMQVDHGENRDDMVYELNLCSSCLNSVKKHKLPVLVLAHHTALGTIPPEL